MTSNRWFILAVLFTARLSMAVQFQSIAALSPLLIEDFGIGLGDIGFLIGLYFAPGVVFALPGGAVAAWFGDKRIVAFGMLLMLVGGAVIAMTESWNVFVVSRFIVGIGGVILNVVMTKLLVDWFAGKEISTAMAIFVNSWPVGIALALLVLPYLATSGGIALAWWSIFAFTAVTLVVFAVFYHAPEDAADAAVVIERTKLPVLALVFASFVWGFYNAALAMVFSFGPTFFVQQGWTLPSAGSVTSLFMLLFSLALPVGGVIADKTGRKDLTILVSLIAFAALMPLAVFVPSSAFAVFCVLGVLFAFGAGPIMTLPAEVLSAKSRSLGMGFFFTIYYVLMMISPRIAGGAAEAADDAGVAILVGAAMSFVAALALLGFRVLSRR